MNRSYPPGWEKCKFGQLVKIRNGYAFKSSEFIKSGAPKKDIPLVRQSQLVGDKVVLADAVHLSNSYLISHKEYLIKDGDIIIGMSGSIGKVCEYKYEYPALQNQRTGVIKPYQSGTLSPKFFGLYLSSIERKLLEYAKGMGVQNISAKDISNLEFDLPPLDEQDRIVAKIEELFTDLYKGIESLEKSREQLKVYRQSLLKNAFEGKLTEKWRKDNSIKLETSDELFMRLQKERAICYQQLLDNWEKATAEWENDGKEGRRPRKPKTIAVSRKIDDENNPYSFNLPDQWRWVRVLDLLDFKPSNGRSVTDRAGGFKVLRLTSLKKKYIDNAEAKEGDWDFEDAKPYIIKKGDFLLSRGNGSIRLVGKGAIVKENADIAYPDTIVRLSITSGAYLSELFYNIWNSAVFRRQIESSARTTAGIYKINQALISDYVIPLIPEVEQGIISEILEKKLSIIDTEEQSVEENLTRSIALRQSILIKAFSGQLVAQDPNDEPASELLKRIAEEKREFETTSKAAKAAANNPRDKQAATKKKKAADTQSTEQYK